MSSETIQIKHVSPEARAIEVAEWHESKSKKYAVLAVILEAEPEGVPVYTPSLPGVASYGNSEPEAIRNLGDAIRAAVESYEANDQPIPWVYFDREPKSEGKNLWIEVDA